MQLTLYKEDFFDASHRLNDYEGKCAQSHGHTWKICIWVRGEEKDLQPNGVLWDFSNIKEITNEFDHQFLNEVITKNPTAENLTIYVYKKLKKEYKNLKFFVRIYENALSRLAYCQAGDFDAPPG
jgi:6-pyruvoyltetrahydropterin/6-carboxytetrahydropterin synthase